VSICADETTLPPGIIYDGKNGNINVRSQAKDS
jgi:hypothetical protein